MIAGSMPTGAEERVAIASSHAAIRETFTPWFRARGFVVRACPSLSELMRTVRLPRLRLVLLRDDLADISGAQAGLRLRWHGVRAPLILLARESDPELTRDAIAAGANAVLPDADVERVFAHAEALINRSRGGTAPVLRRGPYLVDVVNGWVELEQQRIPLTLGQARIFWFLCLHANTVVRLEELVVEVAECTPNSAALKAMAQQVMRLRLRLGARGDGIETLRGAGYVLRLP